MAAASSAPAAPDYFPTRLSQDAEEAIRPIRAAFRTAEEALTDARENLDSADYHQFRAETLLLS